jgi:hypothetical protein
MKGNRNKFFLMKQITLIDNESYQELIQMIEKIDQKLSALRTDKTGNRWLTNKEVSEMLSVTGRTLQNYRDNGILPFSKIGSNIFYKLSDLEDLLNSNYCPSFSSERRAS